MFDHQCIRLDISMLNFPKQQQQQNMRLMYVGVYGCVVTETMYKKNIPKVNDQRSTTIKILGI